MGFKGQILPISHRYTHPKIKGRETPIAAERTLIAMLITREETSYDKVPGANRAEKRALVARCRLAMRQLKRQAKLRGEVT